MENFSCREPEIRAKEGAANLFGPRCNPLFYTALRTPPRRLSWNEIPDAPFCRIALSQPDREADSLLWSAIMPAGGITRWELPALDLTPGTLYSWHIEPIFAAENPAHGTTLTPLTKETSALQAHFWLLDSEAQTHVQYGLELLATSPDLEYALLAQAILLSEAGLFQEALHRVQQVKIKDPRVAQSMLADTAQSVIYRQMERHLTMQDGLPACFGIWVRNREKYHRSRVRAQMTCAQVQTPAALHERGYRRDHSTLPGENRPLSAKQQHARVPSLPV